MAPGAARGSPRWVLPLCGAALLLLLILATAPEPTGAGEARRGLGGGQRDAEGPRPGGRERFGLRLSSRVTPVPGVEPWCPRQFRRTRAWAPRIQALGP